MTLTDPDAVALALPARWRTSRSSRTFRPRPRASLASYVYFTGDLAPSSTRGELSPPRNGLLPRLPCEKAGPLPGRSASLPPVSQSKSFIIHSRTFPAPMQSFPGFRRDTIDLLGIRRESVRPSNAFLPAPKQLNLPRRSLGSISTMPQPRSPRSSRKARFFHFCHFHVDRLHSRFTSAAAPKPTVGTPTLQTVDGTNRKIRHRRRKFGHVRRDSLIIVQENQRKVDSEGCRGGYPRMPGNVPRSDRCPIARSSRHATEGRKALGKKAFPFPGYRLLVS